MVTTGQRPAWRSFFKEYGTATSRLGQSSWTQKSGNPDMDLSWIAAVGPSQFHTTLWASIFCFYRKDRKQTRGRMCGPNPYQIENIYRATRDGERRTDRSHLHSIQAPGFQTAIAQSAFCQRDRDEDLTTTPKVMHDLPISLIPQSPGLRLRRQSQVRQPLPPGACQADTWSWSPMLTPRL